MGIDFERRCGRVPSLMLRRSLADGCETSMRCHKSLELANLSSRRELRTFCSVVNQDPWLARACIMAKLRT